MNSQPDVSQMAEILADKSRCMILSTLLDNCFHTVTELARASGIKSHTASYHLKKLTELNWIRMEKHGRFHYYRLCNKEVADVLEQWLTLAPLKPGRSLSQSIENTKLFRARLCYDHVAGELGVMLTDWLIRCGYLVQTEENGWSLSPTGESFLEEQGTDIAALQGQKRTYCRLCLDWSERRHHVAGSVGDEIRRLLLEQRWVVKHTSNRSLVLTPEGRTGLQDRWGVDFPLDGFVSGELKA